MNRETKYYYPVKSVTQEILSKVEAEYRGSMYHIPRDALESEPLQPKQGFAVVAVLDESGKAIDSEYIEDYRGTTIYDESDCTKSEKLSVLGPIKEGFTKDKPLTEFDEWIQGRWVTNTSNKFIAEYDAVDSVRRSLYSEICDPLKMEAMDMMDDGKENEAIQLRRQAQAAKQKIKTEHPWPTPPTN